MKKRPIRLRRGFAFTLALALLLIGVPLSSAPADSGVQFIRVLLSTQGVSSMNVPVKGIYTLAQTQRTFTDGTLTFSASGGTVTVSHSTEGQLYSGSNAIIERTNLSRDAGYLTMKTAAGTRNYLGNVQLSASNGVLMVVNRVPLSHYLYGVVGYEMSNTFPLEALKAQAILARTFVLQFVSQKESMYDGADISTDIKEAQAYDAAGVNARIREAVKETRGEVLNAGGELPYAWFHAHSGGLTARAKEGLDYEKAEPGYTQCVKGMENDEAPAEAAHWQAGFSMDEVMAAAKASGVTVDKVESIAIGQRGESGRAKTLLISGKSVSAPAFRIAIGSTKMRSCLLESLRVEDGQVQMSGKGYGHGVGMSQYAANTLAVTGKSYRDILAMFYPGTTLGSVR